MISTPRLRTALAVGLVLVPAGTIAAQQGEPSQPEGRAPQIRQFRSDGRPDPEQMEQFRRQFELFQRHMPGNARTFRFNPGRMMVDPGQSDLQLFFQQPENEASALGLKLREMPAVLRSHLELPEGQGVVVAEVAEDGPAAGAIEPNDILLALGDTPLSDLDDLAQAVEEAEGDTLSITLVRRGEEQSVEVDRPRPSGEGGDRYRLGVMIEVPDDAVRSQLGLAEGRGVIVMEVTPDSAAEEAGIKANDILTEIDGEPIAGAQELSEQVQGTDGEAVELTLMRDGEEITVEVSPEKVAAPAGSPDPRHPPAGLRFFGPGVMIDPETGAIRPGPGQNRTFSHPVPPTGDLGRAIEEMREQLERLREEIDALKRSKGDGEDQDR
ncbi:PDZ domain-containing protein [Tautonia plasticadhaerens]|uniref:Periplasmic serine endoprotease DegP n=1 Tax=Tautonia plasticadhaerens TaxID=2527974 RepID=A0A518H950_9BACT|nr:PDZ domain-containing protein [Tautonia plasticadhaerens]QDV37369.1 Periplasmic serine endoprotease DegP precursor [Tautonia plasticadhaerens]